MKLIRQLVLLGGMLYPLHGSAQNTFTYMPAGINICPECSDWQGLIYDGFDDPALNTTIWQPHKPIWSDPCAQFSNQTEWKPSNVSVAGSKCILTAKIDPGSGSCGTTEFSGGLIGFLNGAIPHSSNTEIIVESGSRITVRANFSEVDGAINRIALVSAEDGNGVIEIVHNGNGMTMFRVSDFDADNSSVAVSATFDLTPSGMHDYTIEWDDNFISFLIDGTPTLGSPFARLWFKPDQTTPAAPFEKCVTDRGFYEDAAFFPSPAENMTLMVSIQGPMTGPVPPPSVPDFTTGVTMEIESVDYGIRAHCYDDMVITNPYVFAPDHLHEKSITLGTQFTSMPWSNIVPNLTGDYSAKNFILMLPNFETYPTMHDPTPDDHHVDPDIPGAFSYYLSCAYTDFKCTDETERNGERTSVPQPMRPIEGTHISPIDPAYVKYLANGDAAMEEAIYAFYAAASDPSKSPATVSTYTSNSGKVLKSMENSNIKIYPNPNSGSFTLLLPSDVNCSVSVVDMLGSEVYNSNINKAKTDVRLREDLPAGTYTIRVSGSGINYVEKMTIIK